MDEWQRLALRIQSRRRRHARGQFIMRCSKKGCPNTFAAAKGFGSGIGHGGPGGLRDIAHEW
eukprot:5831712-Pyramimonas_sp.AAC.1